MAGDLGDALSRRERQIMDIIYARGEATAAEVLAGMADPPTKTAVRTLLRILEEKGHLRHRQEGQTYVYKPSRPRNRAGRSALRRVLDTFYRRLAREGRRRPLERLGGGAFRRGVEPARRTDPAGAKGEDFVMSDWLALAASDAPPLLLVVLDAALKGCVLLALAGAACLRCGITARRPGTRFGCRLCWASWHFPRFSAALPRWRPMPPVTHPPQVTALAEILPATGVLCAGRAGEGRGLEGPGAPWAAAPSGGILPPVPPAAASWRVPAGPGRKLGTPPLGRGGRIGLVVPVLGLASLARLGRSSQPVTEPAPLRLLEQLRNEVGIGRTVRWSAAIAGSCR